MNEDERYIIEESPTAAPDQGAKQAGTAANGSIPTSPQGYDAQPMAKQEPSKKKHKRAALIGRIGAIVALIGFLLPLLTVEREKISLFALATKYSDLLEFLFGNSYTFFQILVLLMMGLIITAIVLYGFEKYFVGARICSIFCLVIFIVFTIYTFSSFSSLDQLEAIYSTIISSHVLLIIFLGLIGAAV